MRVINQLVPDDGKCKIDEKETAHENARLPLNAAVSCHQNSPAVTPEPRGNASAVRLHLPGSYLLQILFGAIPIVVVRVTPQHQDEQALTPAFCYFLQPIKIDVSSAGVFVCCSCNLFISCSHAFFSELQSVGKARRLMSAA